MRRFTNNAGIDLSLAVWLARDDYDYVTKPNYISVTTLIKPIRQIILRGRVAALPVEQITLPDISERLRSVMGQTLHSGVEISWKEHYRTSMKALGYPQRVIDMVRINPEEQEPDTLPVYTEVRTEREFEGFVIGGKIDLIIEYRLRDVKMTTVWAYQSQKSVGPWRLQGSLYRWLNPEKVHHDELLVQYLLTDWNRAGRKRDPNSYPPHAAPSRSVELMGLQETEQWVRDKLRLLRQYVDAPEAQIPECSDEDLWRTDPVHKYYANPENTSGRSTKNFEDLSEAQAFMASKGSKGVIKTVPGLVRACNHCTASVICSQYERLLREGAIAES